MLVLGCGHAGGSAAFETVRLGFETTIVGRRPLAQTSPALQRLVRSSPLASHRTLDIDELTNEELRDLVIPFDWTVLANEPRSLSGSDLDHTECLRHAKTRLDVLLESGFDRPGRFVIRIGSPAGERPDPSFRASGELQYVALKRELLQLAERYAESGLNIATVAPGELRSPYSGYQPDPYEAMLGQFATLPKLHNIPIAATSDRSFGEAVVVVAAVGKAGGWYEVSDGIFGSGSTVGRMAAVRGLEPKGLVTWTPAGAMHLYDVLASGLSLDLDLVTRETSGWEVELAAAKSMRSAHRVMAASSMWWAGPDAKRRAATASDHAFAGLGGSIVRSLSHQLSAPLLGVMLALGSNRSSADVDALAGELHTRWPALGALLGLPLNPTDRQARLIDAIDRQAERSSM